MAADLFSITGWDALEWDPAWVALQARRRAAKDAYNQALLEKERDFAQSFNQVFK